VIIQCRKCGTKYRFDKMKVTGKGVWVRCRNCETVFFQKNPLSEISSLMDLMNPEREAPEEMVGEKAEERETAAGDTGQEPTWEDAYRETGEEEKGEERAEDEGAVGAAEAEHVEQEPTWEDAYRDAGGEVEIESAAEEEAGEGGEAVEEVEGKGDAEIAEGEALHDIDEKPEAEAAGEEAIDDRSDAVGEAETDDTVQGPKWEETYEESGDITGGEETPERQRVREPWAFGDTDEVLYNERITGKRRIRRLSALVGKAILYLVLIAALAGGVYLWLVPEAREMVSSRVFPLAERLLEIGRDTGEIEAVKEEIKEAVPPAAEKAPGIEEQGAPEAGAAGLRVTLTDVGERFVKGRDAQTVMVVEGSAVNTNTIPVSGIRVRGKILDASGTVLSQEESNCGTILTDDELKSLTGDEISTALSNPDGRDFRNADIKPGDGIPFMLVFTMPAQEASELVVELIGIEAAESQ